MVILAGCATAAPPDILARGACRAELVTDDAAFLALEAEWNEAVERARIGHPFLRHEWLRTWWECFGSGSSLQILVVRRGPQIVAIAPLVRDTTTMYGMPVRRIRLLQNDHTPRADFIVTDDDAASYRAIWNALHAERARWDVLQLNQVPTGSATLANITSLAAEDGCQTGTWKSGAAPYLELGNSWDEYFGGLSSKFRQNVRNRLSRLTRIGEPALETLSDGQAMLDARDESFRLEASGWKDKAGTSICSDPAVHDFRRLAGGRLARGCSALAPHRERRRIATYTAPLRRPALPFQDRMRH